jgi:hypothetical protein
MRLFSAATAAATVLLATATSASAAELRLADPAGDAPRGQLDIISVTLDSRERAVVARVDLVDVVRGDVILSVDRRGGQGVLMVTERRSDGTTKSQLRAGAFTDTRGGGPLRCRGFSATWDEKDAVVTFRLPSRCWADGDYGAVRFTALTERGGGDSDLAPDEGREASRWIARG